MFWALAQPAEGALPDLRRPARGKARNAPRQARPVEALKRLLHRGEFSRPLAASCQKAQRRAGPFMTDTATPPERDREVQERLRTKASNPKNKTPRRDGKQLTATRGP